MDQGGASSRIWAVRWGGGGDLLCWLESNPRRWGAVWVDGELGGGASEERDDGGVISGIN